MKKENYPSAAKFLKKYGVDKKIYVLTNRKGRKNLLRFFIERSRQSGELTEVTKTIGEIIGGWDKKKREIGVTVEIRDPVTYCIDCLCYHLERFVSSNALFHKFHGEIRLEHVSLDNEDLKDYVIVQD
jgi:hypothetical protein